MKRKKKDKRIKYSLFSFHRFFFAFCVVGFVVTVSFLLFLNPSWFSENVYIPVDTINKRAISTLLNIIFLCLSFAVIDSVRRRVHFGIPLENILDATREITNGNFKVRIKPLHKFGFRNELDVIMDDFNKMAEELESNTSLKNDFIADVSHEFKTPITAIEGYSTLLQNRVSVYLWCLKHRQRTAPLSVYVIAMPSSPVPCSMPSLPRRLPQAKSIM